MNAISYINGDTEVTDFPTCSARPLAAFVQRCNDVLAGPDGYLSPEDSVLVLDLGWLTVGTAQVSHTVIHAWVAELLTNPTGGLSTTLKAMLWKRFAILLSYTARSHPATRHLLPPGSPPTAA